MSTVAPAILAENTEVYKQQIDSIREFATRAHIDVSDGEFAPNFTVNTADLWWPEEWQVDIHAMVQRPEEHLATFVQLKPSLVIFHAEAEGNLPGVFATLKQYNIRAGLALLRHTVPDTVAPLIEQADHVMIFTGELGRYGGTASMMQLEKVRLVKRINPEVEIGWDGGVNVDNAYTLTQGGVNVLNVGGAIQRAASPSAVYHELVAETHKKGVL